MAEAKRALYQIHLPSLIEQQIYQAKPETAKWKLGALHNEWNEYLLNYKIRNIKAPRLHLKTMFWFEARVLQAALFERDKEILYIGSNGELANKKLDNVKRYLQLPYFNHLLAGANVNNKSSIEIGNGLRIFAQGFESAMRGGHQDEIILDDIIGSDVIYSDTQNVKSKERLAMELLPMLKPDTALTIIGTIQREDDIYSIDFGQGRGITKSYDAIVDEEKQILLLPEVWSWKSLMAQRQSIIETSGEKFFNKEYRNMPLKLRGDIIKPEWFQEYETLPDRYTVYSGWDLSTGKKENEGDFTAKLTVAIDELQNIYILDVYHARIDFGQRVRQIVAQGEQDKPTRVAIEDNVFQADTVQVAKNNSYLNIVGVKTTINKVQKYNEVLVPLFENRKVFFKKGDAKQRDFWVELCSLPSVAHDDRSDALCICLKDVLTLRKPKFYI